ncbi:hypothetical protein H4R18_005347 [Coemansia javaensis]|uniref:RRM domain-containing protein n=1 Tax=Coemansia javaensis TaxID=2761396 RepID=A0A9W8LEG2_9FUNG|nr:hypothetical protein H4R18_005347 [Coemansia javaensis]
MARIKVANISKHVTGEMLSRLFGCVGEVTHMDVQAAGDEATQEAAVEFADAGSARAAVHLSGTELAERALVVLEDAGDGGGGPGGAAWTLGALAAAGRGSIGGGGSGSGGANAAPLANAAVVAQMAARGARPAQAIPPSVAALIHPSILQFDPAKAEEISRTVYVGNIAARTTEQELMDFFSACGPVAYVKMAGDGLQPTRFAFVEFAEFATAQAALQMNGMRLADRALKVNHSKNAINKPGASAAAAAAAIASSGGLAAPAVASAALLLAQQRSAPTLAAVAALPGNVDPAALGLQHQRQAGPSWPMLGSAAAAAQAERASSLERKVRDLQAQMDEKYAGQFRARSRARSRSRSRSRPRSSHSRRHASRSRSHRRSHHRHRRDDDDDDSDYDDRHHHRYDSDDYRRRGRHRSSRRRSRSSGRRSRRH